MITRRGLVALLLVVQSGAAIWAAAPPARLTPAQQKQVAEQSRWLRRAQSRERAGDFAGTIEALQKGLELERAVFGSVRLTMSGWLTGLANLHEQQEQFKEALTLRQEVLRVRQRYYGADDWRVTDARLDVEDTRLLARLDPKQRQQLRQAKQWNSQVFRLWQQGKSQEALPLAQKALLLRRTLLGEKHRATAASWFNLAAQYHRLHRFKEAESCYRQTLVIHKETVGEKHPSYATGLRNLASVCTDMGDQARARGDYRRAEPLYEQACHITKQALGEKHSKYATTLHKLGSLYHELGDQVRAKPLLEQARDITREALGEKNPSYAASLNTLALLYKAVGDSHRAKVLYEQARDIIREALGEKNSEYARSLNGLAVLSHDGGDYAKAKVLFERALAIRKAALGEKHPDYASSLNNLASLYQTTGDHGRARSLFEQALAIRKAVLGEKHPDYAISLNNLGLLYEEMGDHARARTLYEQARDITREALGPKHPYYATILSNLALLYQHEGDSAHAVLLLKQVCGITREALGAKHPRYATILSNLAALYQEMGDCKAALPLLQKALAIYKDALGEEHAQYAGSLHNLAKLYQATGDNKAALLLSQQALAIYKHALGGKHPHYAMSLNSLGLLRYAEGKPRQAALDFATSLDLLRRHLDNTFSALSERQRVELQSQLRHRLNNYLSVADAASVPPGKLYDQMLTWKGAIAARAAEQRLGRDDPSLAGLLNDLRMTRAELAQLASHPPSPVGQAKWLERFRALEKEKEDLQTRLASLSTVFRRQRQVSSEEIAKTVPPGAALIDFLEYIHWTPSKGKKGDWDTERRFLAFVVLSGSNPICVSLGPVLPIERAVQAWRQPFLGGSAAAIDQNAADRLRQLVWLPLQQALGGAKTVLLAPDGALCALPLAALPGNRAGSFLVEEYTIGYLTSGRHLLELAGQDKVAAGQGLLALGGLDYGEVSVASPARSGANLGLRVARTLPGTKVEIDAIVGLYRDRFPTARAPQILSGSGGDWPELQRLLTADKYHRWRYLHLATHAFFLPAPARPNRPRTEPTFEEERDFLTAQRNPLLRTGLVLSGANASADRGICRSEELADLDLRGTQVVVLSACNTALGKQESGEGLRGLQHAFQLAGARNTIASLWKVRDAGTSLLMEEFYRQLWVEKRSPLQALRQAQLFILKNPDKVVQRDKDLRSAGVRELADEASPLPEAGGSRSHPMLWAAFVLSGEAHTDHVTEEAPIDSEGAQDAQVSRHSLTGWLVGGSLAVGLAGLLAGIARHRLRAARNPIQP